MILAITKEFSYEVIGKILSLIINPDLLYTLYNALESEKIYEEFLCKMDEN